MNDDNSVDRLDQTVVDYKEIRSSKNGAESGLNVILTVIQGREMDFGKSYSFAKKNILIGRAKNNDISINDEKISKKHCEILMIDSKEVEQILIRDLKSTNGTFVNGEQVNQKLIKSGDKIEIGDTVLRLGYNDDLEKEYHNKLFNFAARDSLTNLYNKRYIVNELENQSRIARRNERTFSCIIFDIDDFKDINDNFGHLAGDEYLKKISEILRKALREQDIAGRIGGEEFLIVLPETNLEGAFKLANRLRRQVKELELQYHDNQIQTTISGGVAQFGIKITDSELLLKIADKALYEAKRSGKNKIIRALIK